ncbi:hypothetical protein GGR57DRAFT_167397 [Xylariaceae sp. FL1272]|nr:hypothetical protein GGR57DRAFT_167397 [Xylariaceae sp. FL1272]
MQYKHSGSTNTMQTMRQQKMSQPTIQIQIQHRALPICLKSKEEVINVVDVSDKPPVTANGSEVTLKRPGDNATAQESQVNIKKRYRTDSADIPQSAKRPCLELLQLDDSDSDGDVETDSDPDSGSEEDVETDTESDGDDESSSESGDEEDCTTVPAGWTRDPFTNRPVQRKRTMMDDFWDRCKKEKPEKFKAELSRRRRLQMIG